MNLYLTPEQRRTLAANPDLTIVAPGAGREVVVSRPGTADLLTITANGALYANGRRVSTR